MAGRCWRPSLLSGRLQGGFVATSLPSHSSGSSGSISDKSDPRFNDYIPQSSLTPEADGVDNASLKRMLKPIHDKISALEERHMRLTVAFKELNSIVIKQERDSFTIKSSPFEVSHVFVTLV